MADIAMIITVLKKGAILGYQINIKKVVGCIQRPDIAHRLVILVEVLSGCY